MDDCCMQDLAAARDTIAARDAELAQLQSQLEATSNQLLETEQKLAATHNQLNSTRWVVFAFSSLCSSNWYPCSSILILYKLLQCACQGYSM